MQPALRAANLRCEGEDTEKMWFSSSWFRRKGSDSYFSGYQKSFEQLELDCARLTTRRTKRQHVLDKYNSTATGVVLVSGLIAAAFIAWMNQQPKHLSIHLHFSRIAAALATPVALSMVSRSVSLLLKWLQIRDERSLKRLADVKRKLIVQLKDSMCFDKTASLIRKYDPDSALGPSPSSKAPRPGVRRNNTDSIVPLKGGVKRLSPASQILKQSVAAAGMAAGAGRALMPMFDKLASSVIGDCPILLEDIRQAQQEAHALKIENDALKKQLLELQLQLTGGVGGQEKPDSGDEAASVNTEILAAQAGAEQQLQLIQTIPE